MKVHQVFWTNRDKDNLQMRRLSCFECNSKDNCKHYHLRTYKPKCLEQQKTCKNSRAMKINPGVHQEDQTAHRLTRVRYSDIYSSDSDENDELDVGSWVGVVYDTQWYPGIVENKGEKITVSFMARSGQKFFWPSPPDIQMLNPAHIMCRINKPPHPVSNRHYGFENIKKYDEIFNKMLKTT
ncbi:uncharacterized protein LOC128983544 [Macrosteles quadrilineatus]|uniref:uncharacterized protein LOC128983544 n=1 Tax=Macrosteles quadrilineatus TaxID=74068 RepID=UPI0023E2EE70|nr:uncharacterized protein LOC128983544 [Macrosteles quadrilineatus]